MLLRRARSQDNISSRTAAECMRVWQTPELCEEGYGSAVCHVSKAPDELNVGVHMWQAV